MIILPDTVHCHSFQRHDVSDAGSIAVSGLKYTMLKEDASKDGDKANLRNVVFIE
jgi:hypothetical protein